MASSPAGKKPAPKKTKAPAAKKAVPGASARPKKPAPVPAKKKPAPKPARKTKAPTAPAQPDTAGDSIPPQQQRFVDEYLIDLNGTQAAIRAGYSKATAAEQASRLLTNVKVAAAISEARKQQQRRTQITADQVLRELALIALGDSRELVHVKVGCCRHCHGEGFRFQRTITEYNHDREVFAKKGGMPADFEEQGGIGFDPHRPPHPDCPECGGDGQARTALADSRYYSPAALALYAGAKTTKFGIEVLTHSKMDAIEKLNRHLGVYAEDNKQKADPLASLLQRIATGNGNGFRPVVDDPEAPAPSSPPTNTLMPRQDVDDDGSAD